MEKLYNFVYWVHAVLSVCFAQQRAVCSIAKIEGSLSQVTMFFLSPKLSSTKCNSLLPHFFLFQVLLLYIKLAISSLLHFFAKPLPFCKLCKTTYCMCLIGILQLVIFYLFFLQSCLCVISLFSADTLGHYQTRATQKPCNNHREQNNIMIESKAYEADNEPTLKHN